MATQLAADHGGRVLTRRHRVVHRLRRNPVALVALAFLVLVSASAILASVIAPYGMSERAGAAFEDPSGRHWFGTDGLGRDVLSRLLYGGQTSLKTAFAVVAVAVIVSLPLGMRAGYSRGWLDAFVMRWADAAAAFPGLLLMLAVAGILGPSTRNTVIALVVVLLPNLTRIVRGQTLSVQAETFVEASRSIGTPDWRIISRHVLPSVASPVIVQATVLLGWALLAEAGLSYLGLGTQLPTPSWGNMLRDGYDTALFSEPRAVVIPAVVIALTVLAFNTFGDGLRDAFGIARQGPKGRSQRRGITTATGRHATQEHGSRIDGDPDRAMLRVSDLAVEFDTDRGPVRVLDGVSFSIAPGEVLGLVGESGCGKTVTALSIPRLLPSPPARIVEGRITLDGRDLLGLRQSEMRSRRGTDVSIIFQDPMTSLDPAFTVGHHVIEAQRNHHGISRAAAKHQAVELLDIVGIADAARRVDQFPHEMSGGMRQRVMIAAAIANNPKLLIADEPTTALDVTVQAQILDLLADLRAEFDMAMLFVTHDLGVIADVADRVAVMYAGQIVEEADVHALFARPHHPYASGLLRAMPSSRTPRGERLVTIPGMVPTADAYPLGCRFASRCSHASDECRSQPIELLQRAADRKVRCVLAVEVETSPIPVRGNRDRVPATADGLEETR